MAGQVNVGTQIKLAGVGLLLCCSTIGLIVSFILIQKGITGGRETKVHIYQTAIDEWNMRRGDFDNLEIFSVINTEESGQLDKQASNNEDDVLQHDYYGKLPYYKALYYESIYEPDQIGFKNTPYATFDITEKVNMTIKIKKGTEETGSIDLKNIPIFHKFSQESYGKQLCNRRYEVFSKETQTCTRYSIAKGLCVKISLENGKWQLNNTFGGHDCTGFEAENDPVSYKKIRVEAGDEINDASPFVLPKFTIKVRSGHDPYFVAEHVTEDTVDFGMDGTQLLVLGIVLLVVSLGVAFQPVLILIRFKKRQNRASLRYVVDGSSGGHQEFQQEYDLEELPDNRKRNRKGDMFQNQL